jgi:hypothetical protein
LKQEPEGAGGIGVANSPRPVSWNHAATDGRVRGDLHHHGAHPEGPRSPVTVGRNSLVSVAGVSGYLRGFECSHVECVHLRSVWGKGAAVWL